MTDDDGDDLTLFLPDDLLILIFSSLSPSDRSRCSLVCRRFLLLESQSRTRLSLDARAPLLDSAPSLLSRFPSVSKLSLRCDRRSDSISDPHFLLLASRFPLLTRLKLRSCRRLSDSSISSLPLHCPLLRQFSAASCSFGLPSILSLLRGCPHLQDLTLKRLRGLNYNNNNDKITTTYPSDNKFINLSLRSVCLKELYNGQCLVPLIASCSKLRSIKILRCCGEWDMLLEEIAVKVPGIAEVHLEKLQVSDRGLFALSSCKDLEVLHLVKTPECTDAGIIAVAERCRSLRRIHIDGWRTNRIGDYGLLAIARACPELQELVLIGVNPTILSVDMIASDCRNLERLSLCGCETFGDVELVCLAAKGTALRKLCIKGCPISDYGLEALAEGCPNLIKLKMKRCQGVTADGVEWLMAARGGSLSVSLDKIELQEPDASTSDRGVHDNGVDGIPSLSDDLAAMDLPSSSNGRNLSLPKARVRNFLASTLRRWSSGNTISYQP